MGYCINPHCPNPLDPDNTNNPICRNCGSDILLQDRYWVIEKLGKGGFGTTFEVSDRGTRKVLKVLTDNNPKAIELFQQEAQVLSQLQSAGIPKVDPDGYFTIFPKSSSTPLHCLVMEKIEGVDLEKWMQSRHFQPISQTQALDWIKQLIEILSLIHTQQYFHRDIKPQNIMLRPNGQLVLIDFGAVRQVTTTILAGICHTRIVSKGYSPPEQQNGYSVQQSDFFALGRTFVFLLTGKEPQDLTIYDPLTNELRWRPYALQISPLFADLIDSLMAPTASQRPENTQIIWQWLEKIEQDLSQTNISQKTLLQTFQKSALSLATTVFSNRNQTRQQPWKILIGSGVGLLAASTVIVNLINANKTVSKLTQDSVNIPISKPSSVTIANKKHKETQTREKKLSPISISQNPATLGQLKAEVIKEKPKIYQVKFEKNNSVIYSQQPKEPQIDFNTKPKRLETASRNKKTEPNIKIEKTHKVTLKTKREIPIHLKNQKTEQEIHNKIRNKTIKITFIRREKYKKITLNLQKQRKILNKQKIARKIQNKKSIRRIKIKLPKH